LSVEQSPRCEDCRSPLATGQRYCLSCGARVGSRSPELAALLRSVHRRLRAERASVETAPAQQPIARPRGSGSILPSPPICALLVAVFLGFGVLLGELAVSPVKDTLAASVRPHLKLLLPAASATAATPESSSDASSATAGGEPPISESEPTPTPTPTAAPKKTTTAAAGAPGSSGGGRSSKGGGGSSGASPPTPAKELPPIKHVFVIMLSDEPYASAFGPESGAHYLSQTLEHKGELLVHYDSVAHEELANEVALLSGQGPTVETAANCPTYSEIAPASSGADEQVLGNGCVYPASTQTLPGQLSAKHLTWRAYVQGIGEAGSTVPACAHPAIGAADPTAVQTESTGAYATFANPLVYFGSITSSPSCAADDVGLSALKGDLSSAGQTPSFSYIAPDRCHDGNPTPCTPGAAAGMAPANAFLEEVVPEILTSKAYEESGLLVITVDEAPSSGEYADSSSCCGQPQFPNLPSPAGGLSPRGGGAVGALLLSPFVQAATTSQEPFNHFSLLRTVEDLFGLAHLGYAALPAVKSFEPSMFVVPAKG
jgi:hypothetical protein